MTESVVLILALVVAPIAALALLTWGLNGTVWLLDRFAGRKGPAVRTVRWRAPETSPGGGAEPLSR